MTQEQFDALIEMIKVATTLAIEKAAGKDDVPLLEGTDEYHDAAVVLVDTYGR